MQPSYAFDAICNERLQLLGSSRPAVGCGFVGASQRGLVVPRLWLLCCVVVVVDLFVGCACFVSCARVGRHHLPSRVRRRSAPIDCVFVDCDDCLYQNGWATAEKLTKQIEDYCVQVLDLPPGRAYELYKRYGTTVRGLVEDSLVDQRKIDDLINHFHDVPLDDIQPDPALKEMLCAIPHPRWLFTAASKRHADRCLRRLGLEGVFADIVSASSREMIDKIGYATKHDPRCFVAAMGMAGIPRDRAHACVILDDSVTNLQTAKALGWQTVLVGRRARDTGERISSPYADLEVDTIHDVREAFPELFVK